MQLWFYVFKIIKIQKIIILLRYLICSMLIAYSIMCIKINSIGQLEAEYKMFKVLNPTKYNRLPLIDLDRCISM